MGGDDRICVRYDPILDTWTILARTLISHDYGSAVVLIGGYGMEQWIARRAVVPFVVQLPGSSPLQSIRSPKNHVYD